MRRRSLLLVAVLAILLAFPSSAQLLQARPVGIIEMLELENLSDPSLSPDGKWLAFTREQTNWRANARRTYIWLQSADGRELRRLTRRKREEFDPAWSPKGRWVAFRSKPGWRKKGEKKPKWADQTQLFAYDTQSGKLRRLTSLPRGVGAFAWAPDGESIYFLAREPDTPQQQALRKSGVYIEPFEVTTNHQQLWRVPLEGGKAEMVTRGNQSVREFSLSRDGRFAVLLRAPGMTIDERHQGELWFLDLAAGTWRKLTENGFAERGAELSPDGRRILFRAAVNAAGEPYYNPKIFLLDVADGAISLLTGNLPYEIEAAHWGRDSRTIYMVANMGVHNELIRIELGQKPEVRQLTDGQHTLTEWWFDPRSGRHVVEFRSPDEPADFWLGTEAGGALRFARLTSIHAEVKTRYELPEQRLVRYQGEDGVKVEGLLTLPLGYEPGRRYPLVVDTHGGPRSSYQWGIWAWREYVPVLAALGYAHFSPNYRGSTGYGDAFLRDMVGHYFHQSHKDVLRGIDHLVAEGIADPDRLAKRGWSAGGHMTGWLITQTDRFKAASFGAGMFDWISMYGESDTRHGRTPWFGGTPWDKDAPIEVYRAHSSISYVWRVRTPTILFVGGADKRVPTTQSMQYYRALRHLGVPSVLYIAPGEPHGWRKPKHRLFKINAELDWFERHVRGRRHEWVLPPQPKAGR